jgi:LEA14-like dessication related protein
MRPFLFKNRRDLFKVLYLTIVVALVCSCSIIKDVSYVSLKEVTPSFENKQLYITGKVEIKNENFFAINIKSSKINVSLDNTPIGSLYLEDKIKLLKKKQSVYAFRTKIDLEDGIFLTLLKYALKKEASLSLDGTIYCSVIGVPKRIKINETHTIDPKMLKIFGK